MLVRSKPPGGGCWFALVALAVTFFAGQASAGPVDGLCGALARQAERAEGIPPGLVHALALAESGRWFAADGATRPWPWTVTSGSDSFFLPSKPEALRISTSTSAAFEPDPSSTAPPTAAVVAQSPTSPTRS